MKNLIYHLKVDIVNYQTISNNFKETIKPNLEIFQVSSRYVPDPNVAYPRFGIDGYACKNIVFLKNIIKNKQYINIGNYTYYSDKSDVYNFEKNVLYHHDSIGDKLIIGKFCQIGSNIKFLMHGSCHPMEGISTYPFKAFSGNRNFRSDQYDTKLPWDIPFYIQVKGDTIVGNDVWIGYNATIMPGIKIGDGAVIAANSTITKNIDPYTIVGGSPAKVIRKRFDDQTIEKLLKLKWWDMDIGKINNYVKDIGLDIKESRLM